MSDPRPIPGSSGVQSIDTEHADEYVDVTVVGSSREPIIVRIYRMPVK